MGPMLWREHFWLFFKCTGQSLQIVTFCPQCQAWSRPGGTGQRSPHCWMPILKDYYMWRGAYIFLSNLPCVNFTIQVDSCLPPWVLSGFSLAPFKWQWAAGPLLWLHAFRYLLKDLFAFLASSLMASLPPCPIFCSFCSCSWSVAV